VGGDPKVERGAGRSLVWKFCNMSLTRGIIHLSVSGLLKLSVRYDIGRYPNLKLAIEILFCSLKKR